MTTGAATMNEDSEILLAAATDQIKVASERMEGEYTDESDDDEAYTTD